MPLCENMPGGKATKPGDVHTAMNGKTIQVCKLQLLHILTPQAGFVYCSVDKDRNLNRNAPSYRSLLESNLFSMYSESCLNVTPDLRALLGCSKVYTKLVYFVSESIPLKIQPCMVIIPRSHCISQRVISRPNFVSFACGLTVTRDFPTINALSPWSVDEW